MAVSFELVKAAILVHGEELASYPHVVKVQPGFAFSRGRITLEPAIVVLVDQKIPRPSLSGRDLVPSRIGRVRVDVRQASIEDQLGVAGLGSRRAAAVAPAVAVEGLAAGLALVDVRTPVERESTAVIEAELVPYVPPPFSLQPVTGSMTVVCHASPDAGWAELKALLSEPAQQISATIFEFNARHVRDALIDACGTRGRLDFVMHFKNLPGFDNKEAQDDLRAALGERLDFAWAAVASTPAVTEGFFPTAYHTKMIVRDRRQLWMSSGNWKVSGQPLEDPFNPPPGFDASHFLRDHNREWHLIIDSPDLASQFERFIRFDLEQARPLQSASAPEREMPDVFVSVEDPPTVQEVEPRFFPPLRITRSLRAVPLLSPDNFVEEVTALVRKTTRRLYIQNQYLKPTRQARWRELNELVGALSRRQDVDFRVILRDIDVQRSLEMMAEMDFDLSRVRVLRNTHTKGILVDDLGIVIGSHNWSGQGFTQNRDASVIFEDSGILGYYDKLFRFDWERARPAELDPPEMAPRLALLSEPTPPGMRRVSWGEFESE